jgi:HAE1 family hydrophobic/amphiphilic exporter-1
VLHVVADRSLFIESSIREVRDTAVIGGILAVLVLYPFLRNLVTTLIVALSIPVSLLVTFAPMHMLGVSLNIMSLGGLALGIGMLVDASIVVLESIHRAREEGDEYVAAAVRGTREVFGAVISTVLTTIAVFFPMVFVEGVAGQAFGDLGLAVTVSLIASMVVALYLIPMLASRRGPNVARLEQHDLRLRRFASWSHLRANWRAARRRTRLMLLPPLYWIVRFLLAAILEVIGKLVLLLFMGVTGLILRVLTPVSRRAMGAIVWLPLRATDALLQHMLTGYPRLLRWSLAHRGLMFVIMGLTILGTVGLASTLDSELLPEVRQGEFTVEVALPVGTPLEQTERILRPVEQAILAEKENIQSLILTLGYDPSQSERSDEGEHTARFKILLKRGKRVAQQEDEVSERLRARFEAVPDLKAQIVRPVLFSTRTPIEIEVHGEDMRQLREQALRVQQALAALPELADVNTTLQAGAPEIQVVYDRDRLTRYGLNVQDVARLVRDKVQGFEATRYNLRDRTIPIIVRLDEADRRAVENVEQLVVNPGAAPPIWLESVADVVLGEGPSEVRRVDGQRVALVRANLAEGSLSGAVAAIRRELGSRLEWPSGMTYFISGQNEEWERSRSSLYLALWLSMFLVYVIMAIQFESLVQPFVIMFTIPMATIGTVVALKLLGIPVSVVVFLGVIMLVGIVVDNAIVLVDYLNQLRRRGLSIEEAAIQAGTVRLRPILMTTLTTSLGLLPMSLGFGDGAEIRTPMAISVIAGLLSSTALTLLIIPTVYVAADGFVARLLHVRRASGSAAGYEGAHAD